MDAPARHGGGALATLMRWAPLAAAAAHLLFFLYIAAARLVYPFELEWIEGGLADEVLAVARGGALYGPPTIHRVAFIYPPLYFYAAAAAARLMGGGFLPLRLVSFAATMACFALIVGLVRRAGGSWAAAAIAAGLFAATFMVGGGWLPLARVDALFLALFLAGVYVLQRAASGGSYLAAGLLFALSFLTKQSALPMMLPLAAYAAWTNRRRGWLVAASFGAAALAAGALLNWASQGWFGYYVFNGALSQPLATGAWLAFWRDDLLRPLGLAMLAALSFIAAEWQAGGRLGFWLALVLGTLGTAYWVRLHLGAVENNLLPIFAVLAVLAGLGVNAASKLRAAAPRVLIYGLCLLQFGRLAYNPLNYLPAAANRAAGQALVQTLAQVKGDVLVPQHGCVAWLAGKPSYAHLAAMQDVLDAGGPPAAQLLDEMRAALRQRRFAAIVVDGPDFEQRFPEMGQNYVAAGSVAEGAAFYSVTGPRTLPEVMYVPRSP